MFIKNGAIQIDTLQETEIEQLLLNAGDCADTEQEVAKPKAGATLPKLLIVHHSVTPRDLDITKTENSINNNHKARGFPKSSLGYYIGYNYIIYGNGTIKQYRRDGEMGAHTVGHNHDSIGICLIGSFDTGQETPSQAQIEKLRNTMHDKINQFNIAQKEIYPHRAFAIKTCYGSSLADDWAKNLILKQKGKDMLAVKRKSSTTVYIVSGNTAFPITGEAFTHIGGNFQDVKVLDDAEFWKFDVQEETPIIKPTKTQMAELKFNEE